VSRRMEFLIVGRWLWPIMDAPDLPNIIIYFFAEVNEPLKVNY